MTEDIVKDTLPGETMAGDADQVPGEERSADGAGAPTSGDGVSTAARRRRRRRGGRGRGRPRSAGSGAAASEGVDLEGIDAAEGVDAEPLAAAEQPLAEPGAEQSASGESADGSAPRRRRSRGGRGRTRSRPSGDRSDADADVPAADAGQEAPAPGVPAADAAAEGAATEASGETRTGTGTRRRRSTGSTAASRKKKAEEEASPSTDANAEPEAPTASTTTTRRRRTRSSTTSAAKAEAPAEGDGQASAGPTRTAKRPRRPIRRRREEEITITRVADKTMLITEVGDRDQIAVLEGRELVEHYITRAGSRSMVGCIYLGKVQNVLPGMEAAFVDVGRGRNAVLYAGEVSYDEEIEGHAPRIEQVLKSGQNVLVQVTKDPLGGKGARLTQEISLPGRFVVFVPNSQVFGISRRLPDKERTRLKAILKELKPPEHGLIVRTAAEGASAEDLRSDLERLSAEWAGIAKSAKRGRAPRVLYEEPELTVRVIRDLFTEEEFKEIVTDSTPVFDQVVAYLKGVAPDLVDKVKMHEGPLPLLEAHHVTEQIHKALDRKVWLRSGGYLVIDKTEAMTVVDVNTGKHVGKANLEETVTKTNLEAAEEIARQLRLRDIGGIILIDFIDMLLEKNKDKVIHTLKSAMAQDKTRSQVFDISPLGILEVTRKRVSAGLLESFSETCPTCEGRGILLTHKL